MATWNIVGPGGTKNDKNEGDLNSDGIGNRDTHFITYSYEVLFKDLSCFVRMADVFKSFSRVSSSLAEEDFISAGVLRAQQDIYMVSRVLLLQS